MTTFHTPTMTAVCLPSLEEGPCYYFFSGKGGVGKTTLAAATAVHLARSGKRVLIASTDPAHSLSDVFDAPIGHDGAQIEPNLKALETDSAAHWMETTTAAEKAMEEEGKPRRQGRIERTLKDAMKMMGDAPGVDEFVSLELLLATMSTDAFDTVVFDTAPTGHTLKLLMLPEMLDGWLGKLLTIRKHLSRIGRALSRLVPRKRRSDDPDLADNLTNAREQIVRARSLLSDEKRTMFAMVTIPEAMSVLETSRAMEQLARHGIPLGVVFANQVQPPSESCVHCRLRNEIHRRELARLAEVCATVPIRTVLSKPVVIRGPDALAELGQELWSPAKDTGENKG